jgi:hypothetical protein
MLYIQDSSGKDYQWFLGKKPLINSKHVENITADGVELERIKEVCFCIPINSNSQVDWFGDHAKFIARTIGAAEL